MNCIAYIRVSTDKQHIENQRYEINEYCKSNNLTITREIACKVSSMKSQDKRHISELLELQVGSVVIVSELSRLGRKTSEVINLVDELLDKGIALHIIRQGMKLSKHDVMSRMMITIFSCFAQMERDFISDRTKQALAERKAAGMKLGGPVSDKYKEVGPDITRLRNKGMSLGGIAKQLGISKSGVVHYLKQRTKKA